jgi:hypothetical protein
MKRQISNQIILTLGERNKFCLLLQNVVELCIKYLY